MGIKIVFISATHAANKINPELYYRHPPDGHGPLLYVSGRGADFQGSTIARRWQGSARV